MFLLALGGQWGCASDPETEVSVVTPAQDGGDVAIDHDVPDADDAKTEGEDVAVEVDAKAPSPMTVAVVATPAAVPDGGSEQESEVEALLSAFAAGSGGIVIERSWSGLSDPPGAPIPAAWDEVGAALAFVGQRHRTALLSVATVDGALDLRPEALRATPWSGIAMRDAARALVDAAMQTAGDEVSYLSLGMEVDRYLTTYPTQASAYAAFLTETMQYAREHPDRPSALRVGATWSATAWLPGKEPTAAQQQLRDGSDALMLSFWAYDSEGRALDPETAAAALGSVIGNVSEKPVVLHQVAYSSSPLLGSSEARQAEFVRALFASLEAGSVSVPFVGIASLHDPEQSACVAFAEARGAADSTELFAFWCSTGLRQRSGAPKDAFAAYLEAASAHDGV